MAAADDEEYGVDTSTLASLQEGDAEEEASESAHSSFFQLGHLMRERFEPPAGGRLPYSDDVLGELLRAPPSDLLETCQTHYGVPVTTWTQVLLAICTSLLDERERPFSRLHPEPETDLERKRFLGSAGMKVLYQPLLLRLLVDEGCAFVGTIRRRWSCALAATIQLLVSVFAPQAQKLRKALGGPESADDASRAHLNSVQYPEVVLQALAGRGNCDVEMSAEFPSFVYETLLLIGRHDSETLCRSAPAFITTRLVCQSLNFVARAALDCIGTKVLRVCVVSLSYVEHVLLPYARRHCKDARWSTLVFYAPPASEMACEAPETFVPGILRLMAPEFSSRTFRVALELPEVDRYLGLVPSVAPRRSKRLRDKSH